MAQDNSSDNSSNNLVPLTILTGLLGSPSSIANIAENGTVTATTLNGITNISSDVSSFLTSDPNREAVAQTTPRAYINYIIFDDHFQYVSGGVSKIGSSGLVKDHHSELQDIVIPKNGYIYVYCSNESPVNVYFDNLQVVQSHGPLVQDNAYSPWGLQLKGISSQALSFGGEKNKHLYNGKEMQNEEFSDGSGLEEYDYGARYYDVQIGRFTTPDPLTEKYQSLSPYVFTFNNPILFVDPDGRDNIVYLYAADKSLTKKQLRGIRDQANANYKKLGLNTRVALFKGKFNKDSYSKLDKTDAITVIGKRDNVVKSIQEFNKPFADRLQKEDFGSSSGTIYPERGQDPTDKEGNNIIAIGTEALQETAKDWKSSLTETGGFLINHSSGHDAGLYDDLSGGNEIRDASGDIITTNLLASGTTINNKIASGGKLSDFVNSPANTSLSIHVGWGGHVSYSYDSKIHQAYINRYGNNQAKANLPTQN